MNADPNNTKCYVNQFFFFILNNVVLASKPKIIIFIKVCYLFTLMPSNAMAIIIIIIITST